MTTSGGIHTVTHSVGKNITINVFVLGAEFSKDTLAQFVRQTARDIGNDE